MFAGCYSQITLVPCQGANSLAYDLLTNQGVVSSRAVPIYCDLLRLSFDWVALLPPVSKHIARQSARSPAGHSAAIETHCTEEAIKLPLSQVCNALYMSGSECGCRRNSASGVYSHFTNSLMNLYNILVYYIVYNNISCSIFG